MNDVIGLEHGLLHNLDVRDRALHEGDFAAHFGEVVFLAGRQIIQDDDAMSAAHQFVYCIRADKTGAARNQVAHSIRLPSQNTSYCTMGAADGNAENQGGGTNGMSKRLGVGLLIVAGLSVAGVWTYRRYEATKPPALFPGEAT